MDIWYAMAIPLLGGLFMLFIHCKKIQWFEWLVLPPVIALMILGMKGCGETVVTRDMEYWGGYITQASFYEFWNEKVSCRHEISCSHTKYCTDDKGNSYSCGTEHSNDGYYHLYDVDDHPEHWEAYDSNGVTHSISESEWDRLVSLFGAKPEFREMNRDYHTKDGNAYDIRWDGDYNKVEPVVTTHTYINRVQASDSIFNYKPVQNAKKLGLYEYPDVDGWDAPAVLPSGVYQGEEDLKKLNALLGRKKQVRVWLLVWKNQPEEISRKQQAHWKNGNKNELVITCSVDDDNKIQWVYVFSWTREKKIVVDAQHYLSEMGTLDVRKFSLWLGPQVEDNWVRRPFKDFNYLTVRPPTWCYWVTYIFAILLTIGWGVWADNREDCDADSGSSDSRYRYPYTSRRR